MDVVCGTSSSHKGCEKDSGRKEGTKNKTKNQAEKLLPPSSRAGFLILSQAL